MQDCKLLHRCSICLDYIKLNEFCEKLIVFEFLCYFVNKFRTLRVAKYMLFPRIGSKGLKEYIDLFDLGHPIVCLL